MDGVGPIGHEGDRGGLASGAAFDGADACGPVERYVEGCMEGYMEGYVAPEMGLRSFDAFYRDRGKRAFDAAFAILALALLWPLIALLGALVALDGGKPFFGHVRVGRGGRTFRCLKLRTMVVDAEGELRRVLAEDPVRAAEWARSRKLARDPRVTRLGAFLRATSLDELPQFWNVLVGDMSLVGPRPVVRAELAAYGACERDYLSMRPGLSGPWQVGARNEAPFATRVRLDVDYARSHSLTGDLSIILRTLDVVLRRTGW